MSVASVVKALGSGGPALLGRAIDPAGQRHVTETETRRGWFRPRPAAAGSGTAGLGRRDASQLPQGSTNARETRICSPWADIGSHLRCCCRCRKAQLQRLRPGLTSQHPLRGLRILTLAVQPGVAESLPHANGSFCALQHTIWDQNPRQSFPPLDPILLSPGASPLPGRRCGTLWACRVTRQTFSSLHPQDARSTSWLTTRHAVPFSRPLGLGAAAFGIGSTTVGNAAAEDSGFRRNRSVQETPAKVWQPVSDRKIRMGIVGYGVCRFGAAFSLQDHPNVEVVAVSDLFPDRCQALAKACRVREDLSVARRDGQGRLDRGDLRGHRRAEPRPALHRSAQARQARRHRGAGRLGHLEDADKLFETGQDLGPEVHDVRDVLLPRRPVRDAARSTGPAGSASWSTAKASTSTTRFACSIPTRAGASAFRRNGIRRTRTPTTSA